MGGTTPSSDLARGAIEVRMYGGALYLQGTIQCHNGRVNYAMTSLRADQPFTRENEGCVHQSETCSCPLNGPCHWQFAGHELT